MLWQGFEVLWLWLTKVHNCLMVPLAMSEAHFDTGDLIPYISLRSLAPLALTAHPSPQLVVRILERLIDNSIVLSTIPVSCEM